jgi:protein-tyrosine-phosphatase
MKRKKTMLFVCKYNAFRSRVAEEYFNRTSRGKGISAISRGIIMGGDSDSVQRRIAKSLLGIDISKRKPLPLAIRDMKEAYLVIVSADDIPRKVFNYPFLPLNKKLIIWNIKDEQKMNKENIKNIILEIKKKVDELNMRLQTKK